MISFLVTGTFRARWLHRLGTSFECITWNALNQLIAVTKNAATVATYQYDPLGRRVEKVAGATTTGWTYDGVDILREMTGGASTTFIHGPGVDEPLAQQGATSFTYLHADGLGSIARHTTSAGAVAQTITYDSWGNIQSGNPSPYGFTGREWDSDVALWFYRARYYSSQSGRFLSDDPLGLNGGLNLQEYVRSRPTGLIDPFGLVGGSASTTYVPVSGSDIYSVCKNLYGCARLQLKTDCSCFEAGPCRWKAKTSVSAEIVVYYNTYNENMVPIIKAEEGRHAASYEGFYKRVRRHAEGLEGQEFQNERQCKSACDWFNTANRYDYWFTNWWNNIVVDSTHHY